MLVDLDPAALDTFPCCGIKNCDHPGRRRKQSWIQENSSLGLRAQVLLAPDGKACGYLESIPGEFAWRAVDASGYLFIHCLWIHARQYQRKGWGSTMLEDCVNAATVAGMKGVAVLTRDGPWLADRRLYLANGFQIVDTAPPDYQLLVRKLDPHASNPAFKTGSCERLARYGKGLTIIRAYQCPYIEKFASEIAETAEDEFGLKPRIVELKSHTDAQNAPTPYAVFSIIYNGRILADHQISRTRFRNLMRTLHT